MNDDMPAKEFAGFLHSVFERYAEHMAPTAAIYVFHPSSYQPQFEDAMNAVGFVIRSQCLWAKNAASFGWSQYRWQHEPVFYAHIKGKAPAWYGDCRQTNGVLACRWKDLNHPRSGKCPVVMSASMSSDTKAAGVTGHTDQEQQSSR